jgi:hypothetical protein
VQAIGNVAVCVSSAHTFRQVAAENPNAFAFQTRSQFNFRFRLLNHFAPLVRIG